jgi:ATP-dependent DNA helicase RecG
MSEILLLSERVVNTIRQGESHFREFKSAVEGKPGQKRARLAKHICQDIGEALVAFANADGGDLLVGVEDDGQITGIPHNDEDINAMLRAPSTHVHAESPLPLAHAVQIKIDDKLILFFSVAKGTTEVYQLPDGRCMRRKDRDTVPETVKRIISDRLEIASREYDRQFVDAAKLSDLDVGFIQTIADQYLRGLSVERYLQQVGLADYTPGGLRIRMAAVLLFGNAIHRFHPRCQVRILKIAGTELKSGEHYNVKTDEVVQGNIFTLLVEVWERLRPYLAYKTTFGRDARFEQKFLYPEYACREAIVNAIAHRDYTISNGIDIFIFDNRIEIRSPGALLSTVSLEELRRLEGTHESRNSLVAKVLRENKFMRELGEGMKRIFEVMRENELDAPELCTDGNSFSIILPNKSVFSSQEEEWLLMFQQFALSPLQKKIIVLGMNDAEISPKDIYRAMNSDNRNAYDKEVTGLRKKNLLIEIRTNPAATSIARRDKIPKSQVPRFKVRIPGVTAAAPVRKPSPAARHASRRANDERTVYLGNLCYNAQSSTVEELLSEYGAIERVDIPIDHFTGLGRGFGFVIFDSPEAASRAITQCTNKRINGRTVYIKAYEAQTTDSTARRR